MLEEIAIVGLVIHLRQPQHVLGILDPLGCFLEVTDRLVLGAPEIMRPPKKQRRCNIPNVRSLGVAIPSGIHRGKGDVRI